MPSTSSDPEDKHSGQWRLIADLDELLHRARGFLHSQPALHINQLRKIVELRRHGPQVPGPRQPVFGVLERAGAVTAAFLRMPLPSRLSVTPLTVAEAEDLAAFLGSLDEPLPGFSAVHETAAAFAEAWRRRTGITGTPHNRQRLYRLAALTPPESAPPGRARVAVAADRKQLACWYGEFTEEVGMPAPPEEEGLRWADERIAYGGITLWESPDGTPVSMACAAPQLVGAVRLADVYTPLHLRGRGYAGAVTVAVSRAACAAGAAEVLLFTDPANPTSNALYQRLGYRPVRDFTAYRFDVTPTATAAA
ncbi:GNAT family N-acetyltransferase [Streptomyces sp. NBC_01451]|uniref:GNAT family N-acetyltransferase n=1 Tax=Streptomyces sp. NBC_01451 TaxID=2903872 RepID=UPI002E2F2434|nr:GNAT family N-acetyltransferase [Streptomyces sp. NBC_01451]